MSELKNFNPTDIIIDDYRIFKMMLDCPSEFPANLQAEITNLVSLKFHRHKERKKIKLEFDITIEAFLDNVDERAKVNVVVGFQFNLEKIESDFEEKTSDGKFILDGNLASALMGIGYSTIRGLLVSKFQGTYFENYLIPVIDIRKFIEESGEGTI